MAAPAPNPLVVSPVLALRDIPVLSVTQVSMNVRRARARTVPHVLMRQTFSRALALAAGKALLARLPLTSVPRRHATAVVRVLMAHAALLVPVQQDGLGWTVRRPLTTVHHSHA